MKKKTLKPIEKRSAPTAAKPAPVPEGAARSASYVISLAVHAVVLLLIFFSAQFIKSTPAPEPEKKFQEVVLQFDMGVPGADGLSVMETLNPDPNSSIDNPDQGSPDVEETNADPVPPREQNSSRTNPDPSHPSAQTTPHPNATHQPRPASNNPDTRARDTEGSNNSQSNNTGGPDATTSPGDPNGNGNPSHGTGTEDTGRESLPGTVPAQPGWCRTKDDQNNPGATYSYKGGTYRCNCTLGQSVTCKLVSK